MELLTSNIAVDVSVSSKAVFASKCHRSSLPCESTDFLRDTVHHWLSLIPCLPVSPGYGLSGLTMPFFKQAEA